MILILHQGCPKKYYLKIYYYYYFTYKKAFLNKLQRKFGSDNF